jgi:hypothetical protein
MECRKQEAAKKLEMERQEAAQKKEAMNRKLEEGRQEAARKLEEQRRVNLKAGMSSGFEYEIDKTNSNSTEGRSSSHGGSRRGR